MAGIFKPQGSFAITPHKVSVCLLVQIYASPSGNFLLPEPFSSIPQHNRFGLYLLALTKSCDDILEPKLDKLVSQLREISGSLENLLTDELMNKLSSFSSPDDLFNFFCDLRGIIGGVDSSVLEDDQISLDPSSNLGTFVRRCLLAFNLLSFEGVCHLLSNIELYYREATVPGSLSFDLSHLGDSSHKTKASSEYEKMDLENFVYEKVAEEAESSYSAAGKIQYHLHAPKALHGWLEGAEFSAEFISHSVVGGEGSPYSLAKVDSLGDINADAGIFLRSNWQMQQYLLEQADELVKKGSSIPFNSMETSLRQLRKLAPELHRVHFLRYSNHLQHVDFSGALENLHRYFDYCAGIEGFDLVSSLCGGNSEGRYEIALLCLGMLHFHFGHPEKALEVLTEAVWVSQQHNNDSCLAHTLTAICDLLSEFGITSTARLLGSSYSPMTGVGTSLTIQQQLFVLLKRSLHMAENLKLTQLSAANYLTMAKFGMRHVQRPLLSFGPKTSVSLRSCPANVCKDIRLSCRVISEFTSESSAVSSEGALSNTWLRTLERPNCPLVLNMENESTRNGDALQFCSRPSSIPGSVLQLVGSSCLLRATAWEIYGSATLAQMNALVYATNFADSSSADDLELAYVKLVQHLAVYKGYKEAFVAFRIVEEKALGISKSRILRLKLQLLHDLAIHRGDVKLAQQVCDEIGVLASSVIGVDMELKVEAGLFHARTLLAGKQYNQAAQVANSLFCMCYKFNFQVENASVLLLLAEVYKKAGNPVVALPYVLASLSFCQSYNLDLLKASSTLTLAELWLSLGSCEAKAALNLLYGAFPMILGHGGLELRARAHIAEAKCYLSDPHYSVFDEPEVVLDPLAQACKELEVLEYHEMAGEASYLMAIVHDKLGNLDEREKAADSFKRHILASQNPRLGSINYLFTTLAP